MGEIAVARSSAGACRACGPSASDDTASVPSVIDRLIDGGPEVEHLVWCMGLIPGSLDHQVADQTPWGASRRAPKPQPGLFRNPENKLVSPERWTCHNCLLLQGAVSLGAVSEHHMNIELRSGSRPIAGMRGVAYRMLGSPSAADNAVQESGCGSVAQIPPREPRQVA